jgi:L-alanine-DL-glutamate epimerase-like enolase superfamily enzyme
VVQDYMATTIARDRDGDIRAPDGPGFGVKIDAAGVRRYLLDVEIKVGGKVLYRTPDI